MPESNDIFSQIVEPYRSLGLSVKGPLKGYCGIYYSIDTGTGKYGLEIVKVYQKGAILHFHKSSTELYNLLSGNATLYINGIQQEMVAGQPATVILPNQLHKIVPKCKEDVILQVIAVPRMDDKDHFDVNGNPLL